MPRNDGAVWELIRDWELPDFPPPKAWFGRKLTSVSFAWRLENDLLVFKRNASGLIAAYRQWLFVCAVEGRRMQGSDLIGQAECLHREAGENWAALISALPEGALSGEPATRGRQNDADYQATLDRLAASWPDGDIDDRFWPALWRYSVERKVAWLLLPSIALLAFGGLPLLAADVAPTLQGVFVGSCLVGVAGLVTTAVMHEFFGLYMNDDRGG